MELLPRVSAAAANSLYKTAAFTFLRRRRFFRVNSTYSWHRNLDFTDNAQGTGLALNASLWECIQPRCLRLLRRREPYQPTRFLIMSQTRSSPSLGARVEPPRAVPWRDGGGGLRRAGPPAECPWLGRPMAARRTAAEPTHRVLAPLLSRAVSTGREDCLRQSVPGRTPNVLVRM